MLDFGGEEFRPGMRTNFNWRVTWDILVQSQMDYTEFIVFRVGSLLCALFAQLHSPVLRWATGGVVSQTGASRHTEQRLNPQKSKL